MHGLRIRLGGCAAPGPEGMFRTGESFDYLECEPCGSLRIDEVPADLSRHYESDRYYSFRNADEHRVRRLARYRRFNRLNTELLVRTGFGKGYGWLRGGRRASSAQRP